MTTVSFLRAWQTLDSGYPDKERDRAIVPLSQTAARLRMHNSMASTAVMLKDYLHRVENTWMPAHFPSSLSWSEF
jgi:hypothetical protein